MWEKSALWKVSVIKNVVNKKECVTYLRNEMTLLFQSQIMWKTLNSWLHVHLKLLVYSLILMIPAMNKNHFKGTGL